MSLSVFGRRVRWLLPVVAVAAGLGALYPPAPPADPVQLEVWLVEDLVQRAPVSPPDLRVQATATLEGEVWLVSLPPDAATELSALTAGHVGMPLAIAVDDVFVGAPVVREPLRGDLLRITLGG